jgi:four helix bundle protein
MIIFDLFEEVSQDEKYLLTDQIRRSSLCFINIAEATRKTSLRKAFYSKLTIAMKI